MDPAGRLQMVKLTLYRYVCRYRSGKDTLAISLHPIENREDCNRLFDMQFVGRMLDVVNPYLHSVIQLSGRETPKYKASKYIQ